MNMSRNAADAPSSAPSNPPDEPQHRSSRRPSSSSPPRRPHPTDPRPHQGASPSSNTPSHHHPSSSSRVDTPSGAAPSSSDPESSSRKRKRAAAERSSPSGSSSQGDMADTEEGGPRKPSPFESAPSGPPPKKKRTRTLTTPHQAAVLHALLAQSRFPTTQMREEVGRSIGLSARKVQNQRQKARRPRGQASTTSAPLTRPPQFGPFTNAPPGSSSEVSPTATTIHQGSLPDAFYARGAGGGMDMGYGAVSAPSSAASERFAHRDPYLADDFSRSGMPPTQLAGPGIPGPSRRPMFDDPAWRARPQGSFSSRPSTAATETADMYRLTPRPRRPAGEQGPELTLTLPPVMTNVPQSRGPMSSPMSPLSAGAYPTLASISALEASASAHRPALDDRRRILPPPNVDFSTTPRRPLNFPPPFTLQPQPQWDDPAFSPFTHRRSPPPLPHGVSPPFGSSPTSAQPPYRGEPLPSISTVVPLAASGSSPTRSPLSPSRRTRFDPVRSMSGRAFPEHAARPGFHDAADDRPDTTR